MAYSTDNPPMCVTDNLGDGMRIWTYKDADAIATVVNALYFTNGDELGMQVGDMVRVYDTTNDLGHTCSVTTVTAGSGATVTEDA